MSSLLFVKIIAQVFSFFVGFVSYNKKSVSLSGLLALVIISSLFIWLNQIALLFVVFFMYASSSFLTKFKNERKKDFETVVAKTGPRDYIQALANLGVASGLMVLYSFFQSELLLAAFIGSVSAANADSWASEIGGLSKSQPVMITTFKPIKKGISGGVTGAGMLGGVLGSFFISISAIALIKFLDHSIENLTLIFFSAFLAGIFGFILDSYFGALTQALYRNLENQQLTENPKGNSVLVRGFEWINNDTVNLLTTLISAAISAFIFILLLKF